MFNFSGGLLAGQHDSTKEKPPPSKPIPITFPAFTPPSPTLEEIPPLWCKGPALGLPAHFLDLKKPSDVGLDTLRHLNVSFEPQCEFETLLSTSSNDVGSYMPPKSWLEKPIQTSVDTTDSAGPFVRLLSNGRRVPDRNEFYMRAKELFFRNEDAFSSLTRKASADKVPLRLAHFRRFWEGLDNMAYYWDNSLDAYFPPKPELASNSEDPVKPPLSSATDKTPGNGAESRTETVSPETEEEPRKKPKTAAQSNETISLAINSIPTKNGTSGNVNPVHISSSKALPARIAPPKVPWAVNMQDVSEKPADLSQGSYRGYRIGNGAEMPDQYRLDCVRAFLEPIAWAFGVTFVPHRRPPVLCLEHVRFPVRMNSVGWRGPADRIRARQGWMEGPLLGIQCRPDTNFGANGNLEAESILDIVRELGGMLLLAQERAREGRFEKRGGEGKWWTSQPRWGGGPGGEDGDASSAKTRASRDSSSPISPVEDKPTRSKTYPEKRRPRPSPADIWKVVRPGNPIWDPKIVYEAIGKDKDSDWDEIFMVSSLNHHISVLKFRVHRLYIQYLTDGTLPDHPPSDPRWMSPVLTRTRWYDLFSVEDRTEAMRGIWGIVGYLMRSQQQQKQKDDVPMTEG